MRLALLAVVCTLGIAACASRAEVFRTDLTRQTGVYVLGYTTDDDIRITLEDQLVADLAARDIRAWSSHPDLPELEHRSAAEVVRAANGHEVAGIILINEVAADASDSLLSNPERVTPLHPDLQAFFRESRSEMADQHALDDPVFAEVNLFLVDGTATRLLWSGTTWSFHADGEGTGVRGISETIADQLAAARESLTKTPFDR